jgi:thiol:disulfide interchange protein
MKAAAVFVGLAVVAGGGYYFFGGGGSSSSGLPRAFHGADFHAALDKAKSEGKPLVVNFSATWCPPCREMKKSVWTSSKVSSWVKDNAVAVYIDVDQAGDIAQHYGVRGLPTMIVLSKEGREQGRISGGMDSSDLVNWMQITSAGK